MRVLFLTQRLPYAPNRGDRIRAYHIVRTLAPHADVDVVSLAHDQEELAQVGRLHDLGVDVSAFRAYRLRGYVHAAVALLGRRPITHCLLDGAGVKTALRDIVRQRRPDVVLSYCSGMARFAVEPPLADIPHVIDFVDIDSEKWGELAKTAAWPRRWVYRREAVCLSAFERHVARHAVHTLVVNDRERQALQRLAPEVDVHVLRNGVDVGHLRPSSPPVEQPRVVFCGVMDYEPNVEGVLWFAREVWPHVRRHRPDARFIVIGANPSSAIRTLASAPDGVEVTGTVADVRDHLWNAAVSVAPLLTARGLQNKVLEALAAGLPTVVTPQVFDGLPEEARSGCRAAAAATSFAEHTLALLALSGQERRAVAASARLDQLSWDAQLAPLVDIVADAARRH